MGILKKLFKKDEYSELLTYVDFLISAKKKQLLIKRHAIEHAIDMIAKTIAKSEIQMYLYNSETQKIERNQNNIYYYKLNIKPNPNEEATSFFYKVIKKYLTDEEVLIVSINDNLYMADSFISSGSILLPKTFSNVQISDDFGNSIILSKIFKMEDVIYINLKSSKIKETLDSYYKELGSLLGIASNHYKMTNLNKFRLKIPGVQPTLRDPVTNQEITYDSYKEKITKGLFDEEDSVLLLGESSVLERIEFGQSSSSKEWSDLEKKWSDKVAMSYNIPLDIFYGNKTDKSTSTNDFITFGILPHLQITEDALNAKIIGQENYLKGERIKINRLNMKYFDIFESSTSMDKLFSNGYSHNEINDFIGLPRTDEEWADKHYVTKNYDNAENILKGGDGNEGKR